ncbi:cytochrome c oxidase subunit 2 [Novosphingobium sp. PhB57]|uniref:cytochrome c oxidase subunit II n=1 Tax=Novosphingobium sp. PhB57 TaxID=2485107 RepID=UPI0010CFA6EA|nr:cytochrome c oxidase subunit II [Novosphingobium sp. PhB57]TCU54628.1 cytochrome c oxidase subunit 2 [Novosphingobium sp. PhB57]
MSRFAPIVLTLLLGACAGVQTPLSPVGDQASALHSLFMLMMFVCGGVYLVVLTGIIWSVLAARARRRQDAKNGSDKVLSRGLYTAAAVIVAGLTVLIVGSFIADRALIAARDDDAMLVRVTGHQWWWRIEYRDPASRRWIETANELHLPLGRTARIELDSGDVIHSFWVPNVAGKIDMIPGRRNIVDLTPRRVGWFRGQCAEFCGAQHAHMAFDVKVEAPAEFDAWLARQDNPVAAAAPDMPRGMAVFQGVCGSCHNVRGTSAMGRAGPDLTHFASRRSIAAGTLPMTRGGIQGWLAQPQALKPGTSMPTVPLAPSDADAVATYLETLR